ncbi:GMC oxidoreductase [Aureimonas endophytica]|uniref:GMC oxidoreductase n=1 Tax=Aureimonas endophytica TaxID=2027858 RepID=UPI001FCE3F80|nr:GMC oxidoreductase [Aureimonas endophytica]
MSGTPKASGSASSARAGRKTGDERRVEERPPAAAAVADPRRRVHGVEALRVRDASPMPSIPCANTDVPTIMIAERIAETMRRESRSGRRERHPSPPSRLRAQRSSPPATRIAQRPPMRICWRPSHLL